MRLKKDVESPLGSYSSRNRTHGRGQDESHDQPDSRTPHPTDIGQISDSWDHSSRSARSPRSGDNLMRLVVIVAAIVALATHAHVRGGYAAICAAGLITAVLVYWARSTPVLRANDRAVSFAAPIVFAVALWAGPDGAALGALAGSYLFARLRKPGDGSRSYVRFQGGQLALSSYAASAVWHVAVARFGLQAILPAALSMRSPAPLIAISAAIVSALVFICCNALFTTAARITQLRAAFNAPDLERLRALTQVYFAGMLPVVLLTPLGAALGLSCVLPLLLTMMLAAQVVRLTADVSSLRRQLQTADAMGRASVHETAALVDFTTIVNRFLDLAQPLLPADQALVWTLDELTGELSPRAGRPDLGEFRGHTARIGEGLIGTAAARQRPRLLRDVSRHPRPEGEPGSGAWLLYPIVVHDRVLAVAHWMRPADRPFTHEDVTRLGALVPQAAIALENVRIREHMDSLAATDGLTGLWNHRRLQELLATEIRRSARYHRPLSVLMLDVDDFKWFNDTYGHPLGDRLLRSLATVLTASVRMVDSVGRCGGEEFLIILPETTKDDACRLAERIRVAVGTQASVEVAGQAINRTVSVGVAAYPEDALNGADLVGRADEALYCAKRAGKNRVVWA
jgi:diguanylate cyclase (GGDEF)-like protein